MTNADILEMDAIDQARLVRQGEVGALELVDAAIERIEQVDSRINAVVHRRFEKARLEASTVDPAARFAGVPIVLKDLGCASVGDPDIQGNVVLKDLANSWSHDATLTKMLRRAGFIILGRTNTPEFGLVSTTEPTALGATHNPFDLSRSAGGSSGGSAAAVATGMVALAQGTDGGGSLRIPAAHCGIFGLKPSRGRITNGPLEGDPAEGHSVYGFMTKSVRDHATILDLVSGQHPGDPVVAPYPERDFASYVGAPALRLRIGVMDVSEVRGFPVAKSVRSAVTRAANLLESMGHQVESSYPRALDEDDFLKRWVDLISPSVVGRVRRVEQLAGRPLRVTDLEDATWYWYERGMRLSAAQHVENQRWRDGFRRRVASWWTQQDVLLSPVAPHPAPPLGVFSGPAGVERSINILAFTPQFNTSGQPAAAVPMGLSDEGLPIGVQLVAAYGREDLLLSLASQIEQANPWSGRLPIS